MVKGRDRDFPRLPGVYMMKDGQGTILYVGKAKNLRARLASYFNQGKDVKTSLLVSKLENVEYIVTENEYEALVLENNLIKAHNPRYNINLKDGKSYPVVCLTNEDFPRVYRTRRLVKDGSEYFGPFPSVQSLDLYLDLIERIFPLRKCRGPLKKRDSPCLYHHIGRCLAPCAGRSGVDEYRRNVEAIRKLLSGQSSDLRRDLETKMREQAEARRYERAAFYRDAVRALEDLEKRQVVEDFDVESRDYLAWAVRGNDATFAVFRMRGGKLTGRELFPVSIVSSLEDAVRQFLLCLYGEASETPARVFLAAPPDPAVVEYMSRSSVELLVPTVRRDEAVMNLVRENAEHDLRRRLHDEGDEAALVDLKDLFGLPRAPARIEGFDIAQLSGKHPTASMVSFLHGAPDKRGYRRFHVRGLKGRIDDFEAVREVVARRYTRVVNEGLPRPDLIVIDGGKGQLNAALHILAGLGMSETAVIGLAKRNEEIFLPDRSDPVLLPEGSPALRIIQAVRDEAHRFATTFSKKLRSGDIELSVLGRIKGIGAVKSRRLLRAYGSLDALADGQAYEIAAAGGLSLEAAEAVKTSLGKRRAKRGS